MHQGFNKTITNELYFFSVTMENDHFITFNNEQSPVTFLPGSDKESLNIYLRGEKQVGNRERHGQTNG